MEECFLYDRHYKLIYSQILIDSLMFIVKDRPTNLHKGKCTDYG